MSETDNLIDTLSKMIVGTVDKRLSSADFDKSSQGVVTAKNGDTYTIAVFGGNYNITTDQTFTIGQKVLVTAPQGNMKNLTVSPGNVGNMKTVKEGVRDINQRLTGIESDYNFAFETFQKQNDNQIELWFNTGAPTSTNYPAVNWTTEDAKRDHLEDLYFDKKNSIAYEWMKNGSNYYWERLENSTITATLLRASSAQDTADGKRRVFLETPYPPYDVGDTWNRKIAADDAEGKKDPALIGTYGDTYVCVNPRTITQSFNMSDWTKSSKYTDDTRANEVDKKFDDFKNGEYTNFRKDYDTDFKVLDGKIESKVSSTTYATDKEGIEKAIQANQTKIEQTDDTIKLIATEDDLTNAKNQKKSLIEITSENITSTVAASEKKTNGQISELSTQISQNKGNINLCVKEKDLTNKESEASKAVISLTQSEIKQSVANGDIHSEITQTANSITHKLYGENGDSEHPQKGSVIEQLQGSISSKVEKNDVISEINQTSEKITIDAKKINFNGLITFENNKAVGFNSDKINDCITSDTVNKKVTSISGDVITTGTLKAERIKAGTIEAKHFANGAIFNLLWQNNDYEGKKFSSTIEIDTDGITYNMFLLVFKGTTLKDTDAKQYFVKQTTMVPGAGQYSVQVPYPQANFQDKSWFSDDKKIQMTSTGYRFAMRAFVFMPNIVDILKGEKPKYIFYFSDAYGVKVNPADIYKATLVQEQNNQLLVPIEIYGIR